MSEENEDSKLQVKVNDYTPVDKDRFGREAISPIHTENGISLAGLNEGHSTDRDFQMSAVALQQQENLIAAGEDHSSMPFMMESRQEAHTGILSKGSSSRHKNLEINQMLQPPETSAKVAQGFKEDDYNETRDKLYTAHTRPLNTASQDATEYLTNNQLNEIIGHTQGQDVGVQSNSRLLEKDRLTPEITKITMTEKPMIDLEQSSKKKLPPGRLIPAVDFMDMNKTMINFNKSKGLPNDQSSNILIAGETNKIQPKVKVSGAFRHTEYTKGFYKVGTQNTGAPESYDLNSVGTADLNTNAPGGFSEIERSHVLENQSRQPLAKKLFGRAAKKGHSQVPGATVTIPIASIDTNTSRFNSTQDTAWFKSGIAKKGQVNSTSPQTRTFSLPAADGQSNIHNQGGIQKSGKDSNGIMSFGRVIGGSLHAHNNGRNKNESKFKTVTLSAMNERSITQDPSKNSKQGFVSDKNSGTQRIDSVLSPNQANITPSLNKVTEIQSGSGKYQATFNQTDYTGSIISSAGRGVLESHQTQRSFMRRGNSVVCSSPMTSLFEQGTNHIGNFGHPVHLACPKDFTLTPVHRLQPMGFDMNKLPKDMRITSDVNETDVAQVRQRLRRQRFDHMNYDPYVNTKEGQALFNGVLKETASQGDEEDTDEPKNIYAYLINNGLLKTTTRKRGDPIEQVQTRRDFIVKPKAESVDLTNLKSKPLNKIKELVGIYRMNKVPGPPMATINARINEHTERQNKKEYLNSWLNRRRNVEQKLEEGYVICYNDNLDRKESLLMAQSTVRVGELAKSTQEDGKTASGEPEVLSRVPSQKLSTIIHRKNTIIRKEKRKLEKELMRSQMDQLEMDEQARQNDGDMLFSSDNVSERTIQAMQNTSQMILPNPIKKGQQLNGRNYPPWMVNSQIVTQKVEVGKSRVVTRKLNQIVQNPPSQASMGLRHTQLASVSPKKRNFKSKVFKQSISPSQPQTHLLSGHVDKATVQSTTYNADMVNHEVMSQGENQYDKQPMSDDGPTEVMSFTMRDDPSKFQNILVGLQDSTYTPGDGVTDLILDQPSQFVAEPKSPQQYLTKQPLQHMPPVARQTTTKILGSHTSITSPNSLKSMEQKLPDKKLQRALLKRQRQQEAMEDILMLTDRGGRAAQILKKHFPKKQIIMPASRGAEEGTESLFSAQINQAELVNLPLGQDPQLTLVSSDQTIKVEDKEAQADKISNYSFSQFAQTQQQFFAMHAAEGKNYDCIAQICNFQDRVPSELLHREKKTVSSRLQRAITNQNGRVTAGKSSIQVTGKPDETQTEFAEGYQSRLSNPLDVVVENKEQPAAQTPNKQTIDRLGSQRIDSRNETRSDIMSDQAMSHTGFDVMSQMQNAYLQEGSVLSKMSKFKKQAMIKYRMLIDKLKELLDEPEGLKEQKIEGPVSVPGFCYFQPNTILELFLVEKLQEVVDLKEQTLSIEEFIEDYLHFKEFNHNENIMEKLESQGRQLAVNKELFETEEACQKFRVEKVRQTLVQNRQGAGLKIWQYDTKSKTRAMSLDTKQIRKDPLDMGVNSQKPGDPVVVHKDKRNPNYDASQHFDSVAKLCHSLIKDLKSVPQLTKRPKPTSNNLKLDDLGGSERKYTVVTKDELLRKPTN